ncbi:MAG: hypothetical protein Q9162_000806 [Coniocarpon cinnabarinum]
MPGPHYRYDLRSQAIDGKRDRESKQKWGPTPNATRANAIAEKARVHALDKHERQQLKAEQDLTSPYKTPKRERNNYARRRAHYQKMDMLSDPRDDPHRNMMLGDSSNNSSTDEGSPEPDPEANIMYSYDAPTGPSNGEKHLRQLMAVAESRFEDTQTVKLVNSEYDMVDQDGDESVGDADDRHVVDDDYEML